MRLKDKVALVTGGGRGIGRDIVLAYAREGAHVVVNDVDPATAEATAKEAAGLGSKSLPIVADVAKAADINRLIETIIGERGRIDIVVNNAGVYEFVPLEEATEQQFHRMFDTNVLGMLLSTQEALKHLNPEGGSIINIGSLASVLTPPTAVIYNATKGAVDAITRTLAKELGPRKIRVNAIRPGMVITEGVVTGGFHESEFRTMLESQTPLGRVGQTDDIAPAAVFFASDDSKWITGETLLIAGGLR